MSDSSGHTCDSSMGESAVATVQDPETSEQSPEEGTGEGAAESRVIDLTPKDAPVVRLLEAAPVYRTNGNEYTVPPETIAAIESFRAPDGYRQSGSREDSYMYSVGNFTKPVDSKNKTGKFHCQASKSCRINQKTIACKNMSRSNVNKHMKEVHGLVGQRYVSRDETAKTRTGRIEQSLQSSKIFGAGATR